MGTKEVEVFRIDRKLTTDEVLQVSTTLYNLMKETGAKCHPLAPFVSFGNIHSTFEKANSSGYLDVYTFRDHIVGVIMYNFGTPWWASCKVLEEMTVLTVDPNFVGFGRVALERLEELAVEHDCAVIETGSVICLDHGLVKNLYMKKGNYQFSYPNYIRIVN